ncbi:hypothetical protein J6590_085915 [Homalodisca vitripennis]|nr:hypothetical protein J6590_085915 [Homalodisca vitripennis]
MSVEDVRSVFGVKVKGTGDSRENDWDLDTMSPVISSPGAYIEVRRTAYGVLSGRQDDCFVDTPKGLHQRLKSDTVTDLTPGIWSHLCLKRSKKVGDKEAEKELLALLDLEISDAKTMMRLRYQSTSSYHVYRCDVQVMYQLSLSLSASNFFCEEFIDQLDTNLGRQTSTYITVRYVSFAQGKFLSGKVLSGKVLSEKVSLKESFAQGKFLSGKVLSGKVLTEKINCQGKFSQGKLTVRESSIRESFSQEKVLSWKVSLKESFAQGKFLSGKVLSEKVSLKESFAQGKFLSGNVLSGKVLTEKINCQGKFSQGKLTVRESSLMESFSQGKLCSRKVPLRERSLRESSHREN